MMIDSPKAKKAQIQLQKGNQSLEFCILPRTKEFLNSFEVWPQVQKDIIKNRYYRHLRYKWDEILGEEYAHLNENKEKNIFQQILNDSPLVPEYSKIITNLFLEMQAALSNCLASTNSKN